MTADTPPIAAEISEPESPKNPGVNRRHLLLGGAFCVAAGVAFVREPQPVAPQVKKSVFEELIPKNVGTWEFETSSGLVLPPPDALSDRLYDNLVTRIYSSEMDPAMMFLAAYSNTQDGVLQVHRPEICYPAGGYELTPTQPIVVDNGLGGKINANIFTASGRGRTEHVLYWTRIGDFFPLEWSEQRIAVIRANLQGVIPDGVLVRISTILPEMDEALPQMSKFAAQLNQNMNAQGRALLSGVTA